MAIASIDPRSPAATAAAEQALTDARAAEVAAFEKVNLTREELAAGRARVGDLHCSRRALAKSQEATAQAEATVRLVRREAEALREAEVRERERQRVRIRAELSAEQRALEDRFGVFLAGVERDIYSFDNAIGALISRANAAGIAGGRRPSDLGRAYLPMVSGLSAMRQLFPPKAGPHD